MTIRCARALATVLVIFVVFTLFPTEARADAINWGAGAFTSVKVVMPLTLFAVLVEGIFLAIGLRIPYRRTLLVLLAANLASLMGGTLCAIVNDVAYLTLLPRPLSSFFRQYPYAVFLGVVIIFIVTVFTEAGVIAVWSRVRRMNTIRFRLMTFVLIANVVTYPVLAPMLYVPPKPAYGIRTFTDESAWAEEPVTELFCINRTGELCHVTTDGRQLGVLVPDEVRDYQYMPSHGIFLYRNGVNNLCLFRKADGQPITCWITDERFTMEHVACSPEGEMVAYLSRGTRPRPFELVLYDTRSGRTARTGITTHRDDLYPAIAWSKNASTLFLWSNQRLSSISVRSDLTATPDGHGATNEPIQEVYGQFDIPCSQQENGWRAWNYHGSLWVEKQGELPLGLPRLFNRVFDGLCILDNGNELVFDDCHDIYLLNLEERKVGRIVEGTRFIILSPRYRGRIWKYLNDEKGERQKERRKEDAAVFQ